MHGMKHMKYNLSLILPVNLDSSLPKCAALEWFSYFIVGINDYGIYVG
jgi:hypothetical protein